MPERAATHPRVETVNVVTMESGHQFVKQLFGGEDVGDACDETKILIWPGDENDADDPSDAETESFHALTNDICRRVYEAMKDHIAETFVRVANAALDEERTRIVAPLNPPRIETVEVVTREHGLVIAERMYEESLDTEYFSVPFSDTHILIWPDDDNDGPETEAEKHFTELSNEIRDRLHDETKEFIAEAFVRVANEVISRERSRR